MHYKIEETQLLFSTNRVLSTSATIFILTVQQDQQRVSRKNINQVLLNLGFFKQALLSLDHPKNHIDAQLFVDLVFVFLKNTGCVLDQYHIESIASDDPSIQCYKIYIQYEDSRATVHAGELVTDFLNLCQSMAEGCLEIFDPFRDEFDAFLQYCLINNQDANAKWLSRAASKREIPVLNLDQPTFKFESVPSLIMQNGLVQFGYGVHAEKCLGSVPQSFSKVQALNTYTDRLTLISRLSNAGIPVPSQDPATSNCNRLTRVQNAAERISFPISIRPFTRREYEYRERSNTVFGPLYNKEQLAQAYHFIESNHEKKVSVEAFTKGDLYRFLILNHEVIAVSKQTRPCIIGDGIHTITELINHKVEQANSVRSYLAWKEIKKGDSEIITRLSIESLSPDSILKDSHFVYLRGHSTVYNGGESEGVTDTVPDSFKALAKRAAKAAGLSVYCGVDMMIQDTSGDTSALNCIIQDVISEPDLLMHIEPTSGSIIDVHTIVMEQLFKEDDTGRIPLVAITGTDGKTTTCRMVASILKANNQVVGLACSDGNYINDHLITANDHSGISGAFPLLIDDKVEAAVLETAMGGLINYGIAFDTCEVSACLNVSLEHVDDVGAINSLTELAKVKRQVVERASDCAVLNADNPYCMDMSSYTQSNSTILVSRDNGSNLVKTHLMNGGCAVLIKQKEGRNIICIEYENQSIELMDVCEIPATMQGDADHNTSNAMFAMGLTYGLGLPVDSIVKGLSHFEMSIENTPGRLNEISGFPFRVIIDAAHTAKGFSYLCSYINKQNHKGKKIVVFGVRGSLQPDEIKKIISYMAECFDFFILKNKHDHKLEGRKYDEMPQVLEKELLFSGVDSINIHKEPNTMKALEYGLHMADKDDLVVICIAAASIAKWNYLDKIEALKRDKMGGTTVSNA